MAHRGVVTHGGVVTHEGVSWLIEELWLMAVGDS